jgi:hypothetical protein
VNISKKLGHAAQIFRLADFVGQDVSALNEARNQITFRLDKVNDLRPNADGRRGQGGGIFIGPVDAKQFGFGLRQAQDKRLAFYVHPIVSIGDAACERGRGEGLPSPRRHAGQGGFERL